MNIELSVEQQNALVAALTDPQRYPHPVANVERLETHISHILLAGEYAYKIKKPLDLGFLDFTRLASRRACCAAELRLNRRLAPELYLDFIPIGGSVEDPRPGYEPALEYAVKMRRFPQHALLDRCLAEDRLELQHIDGLARQLARFHSAVARAEGPFGQPERVHQPVMENFTQIRPLLHADQDLDALSGLERWSEEAYRRLREDLAARRAAGFIRECHGDLHLGNMLLLEDRVVVFDCIEFNDDFRWIDVMSDLGFLTMDLHYRGAGGLAWRLLNHYLEFTGDYGGLRVLPYYQVYRAMVRAKIAAIRMSQTDPHSAARARMEQECRDYLTLARHFTEGPPSFLLITHGLSGSGKTYLSSKLLESPGAIRVRSDVERKRLFGLGPLENSRSAVGEGIYGRDAGARTYERLRALAQVVLSAGYPVLVDATFLERERRQTFRELAERLAVPFILLACRADPETLRARLAERRARGGDAAEADAAVLEQQLQNYTPPAPEENPLYASGNNLPEAVLSRLQ